MVLILYYILLGVYCLFFAGALFYYLSRRAPGGDASMGWALGIFYSAGLAGVVLVAFLLRGHPLIGLIVLSFPLVFLALPQIRRIGTTLYTRFPGFDNTPLLTLFIENNTPLSLHIKLECWFATSDDKAALHTTLDYYPEPLEKSSFTLTAHQTRLLAHKSKYVTIMTYERVLEEHEGRTYMRQIQPCMQFYKEETEAFRSGEYRIVIDAK